MCIWYIMRVLIKLYSTVSHNKHTINKGVNNQNKMQVFLSAIQCFTWYLMKSTHFDSVYDFKLTIITLIYPKKGCQDQIILNEIAPFTIENFWIYLVDTRSFHQWLCINYSSSSSSSRIGNQHQYYCDDHHYSIAVLCLPLNKQTKESLKLQFYTIKYKAIDIKFQCYGDLVMLSLFYSLWVFKKENKKVKFF